MTMTRNEAMTTILDLMKQLVEETGEAVSLKIIARESDEGIEWVVELRDEEFGGEILLDPSTGEVLMTFGGKSNEYALVKMARAIDTEN